MKYHRASFHKNFNDGSLLRWQWHWKRLDQAKRTSLGLTENMLGYYARINATEYKLGTTILCILLFKTVWEIFQRCIISKGYKGFGHIIRREYFKRRGNFSESTVLYKVKDIFIYISQYMGLLFQSKFPHLLLTIPCAPLNVVAWPPQFTSF